jgi:hypothetical protein
LSQDKDSQDTLDRVEKYYFSAIKQDIHHREVLNNAYRIVEAIRGSNATVDMPKKIGRNYADLHDRCVRAQNKKTLKITDGDVEETKKELRLVIEWFFNTNGRVSPAEKEIIESSSEEADIPASTEGVPPIITDVTRAKPKRIWVALTLSLIPCTTGWLGLFYVKKKWAIGWLAVQVVFIIMLNPFFDNDGNLSNKPLDYVMWNIWLLLWMVGVVLSVLFARKHNIKLGIKPELFDPMLLWVTNAAILCLVFMVPDSTYSKVSEPALTSKIMLLTVAFGLTLDAYLRVHLRNADSA